jgi:predicted ester cyclase
MHRGPTKGGEVSAEVNRAALSEAVERLNATDVAGWMEIHDVSVTAHGLGPEPLDHEGVRAFYTMLTGALKGFHVEIGDVLADGEEVAVRFIVTGRHDGELMGVSATGTDVAITGISIYRFRNGKIVERWTSADVYGFLVQVGVVAAPAAA